MNLPQMIRRDMEWSNLILWLLVGGILLFELAPLLIAILASFTAGQMMEFPPSEVSLDSYRMLLKTIMGAPGTRAGLMDSLRVSAKLAVIACSISVLCGTLGAYAIWKRSSWGTQMFRNVCLMPLLFPEFVTGIALLLLFSTTGIHGAFPRLVLGHVIITIPYVILTVGATLATYDRSLDEAAMSLGASGVRTFFEITIPLIKRGIMSATLIAFIISLNQFTVSYFLFGGEATPLPIWLYNIIYFRLDPVMAALGSFLIVVTFAAAIILEKTVGIREVMRL